MAEMWILGVLTIAQQSPAMSPSSSGIFYSDRCRNINHSYYLMPCDNTTEPTTQEKGCTYDADCPNNSSVFWCDWNEERQENVWYGVTGSCGALFSCSDQAILIFTSVIHVGL